MRSYALELLEQETERDKQKLAGPSLLGSPCDLCVARGLRGENDPRGYYWLGGVIGTAVHSLLEERGRKTFPDDHHEAKGLVVGEIEGYGVIRGTADRIAVKNKDLVDYKTTLKKSVPALKKAYDNMSHVPGEPNTVQEARFKVLQYVGQGHLYARAAKKKFGVEIERVVLSFICRDGSQSEDVFDFHFTYDEEYADAVWNRAVFIWENIEGTYVSDPFCVACALR